MSSENWPMAPPDLHLPHWYPTWSQLISQLHLFFFFFWLYHTACGILVPWPGMEPMPPYWEHRTLNPGLQRSPWRVWEVHNLLMCLHAHMLSCFSRDQLWKTNLRTVAHQAPPSMGFSRQEYWTGVPFLPPGDLPYPGIKPSSPALADRLFTTRATWEAPIWVY